MMGAMLAIGAPPLVEEIAITPLLFSAGRRMQRSIEDRADEDSRTTLA
jgi:hypothetical protein